MPTVDFKPFATGSGANVQAQTDFVAAGSTSQGFSSGIALSPNLNKVWRQASFIAAGIATAVSQITGLDVLDDGNLANFVTNLRKAFGISGTPGSVAKFGDGTIIQSGFQPSVTPNGDVTITFPMPFPNACTSFVITPTLAAPVGVDTFTVSTLSATSVTIHRRNYSASGSADTNAGGYWIAMGR